MGKQTNTQNPADQVVFLTSRLEALGKKVEDLAKAAAERADLQDKMIQKMEEQHQAMVHGKSLVEKQEDRADVLDGVICDLHKTIKKANDRLIVLEATTEGLKRECSEQLDTNRQLQAAVADSARKIAGHGRYRAEPEELQAAVADSARKIAGIRDAIQTHKRRLDENDNNMTGLSQRIEAVKGTTIDLDGRIQDLEDLVPKEVAV